MSNVNVLSYITSISFFYNKTALPPTLYVQSKGADLELVATFYLVPT